MAHSWRERKREGQGRKLRVIACLCWYVQNFVSYIYFYMLDNDDDDEGNEEKMFTQFFFFSKKRKQKIRILECVYVQKEGKKSIKVGMISL